VKPIKSYDLVIIGSGPGGFEVATKASLKGLTVAIIEKKQIGGTCLNVGCIPTKSLYQSAKMIKEIKEASQFGVSVPSYEVDIKAIIERKDQVVDRLKQNIKTVFDQTWVTTYYGAASFIDEQRIHISNNIDNEIIGFKHCIIATGSREFIIPIPGADLDNVLSSSDLLDLPEIPKELVIIGGGVIGCEMASIYSQLGSKVTIIEAVDRILNLLEKDISSRMKAMMKKDGIEINTSTKVTAIEEYDGMLQVKALNKKGAEVNFNATHVLMAVGRQPNIEHLNLQQLGIDYNRKGILVDEHFMTSKEGIYAVGDCIGGRMLAHTATFQSYAALNHILNDENQIRFDVTPSCVFTFPEIATVGMSEEEATEVYKEDVKVSKSLYRANGKANAMGATDGFIKLIRHGDTLVGAHILGESASTIIHQASLIIEKKLSIRDCVDMIHAHPTLSEVLLEALRGIIE
jgi:dihydrolipoamide dehydrogenase